jgi:glutamate synthase domain-containing protein 2/glutamate synthase domain-containing protein 1/glutamate synthase domain-containing protein 3
MNTPPPPSSVSSVSADSNGATPFLNEERDACGVGFVADRKGRASHEIVQAALSALRCVEHRGACGADQVTGDGAGIMTDIPFEFFGYPRGSVAVATLFMPKEPQRLRQSLKIFEDTFAFMGMKVLDYRDVPMDTSVLGQEARESLPHIQHVIIERPGHCRTDESFNKALYAAKQATRTKHRESGFAGEFFFTSLSTTTIVYKALTKAEHLDKLYLDLQDPRFTSRFALVHRRFSTNTRTSWDKAQPFRLIAHNGEINTIAGNRSWAFAREHALGLPFDELLTHTGISDSGSLNEMVEALKYRSSIPKVEDILAIMIPPADQHNSFYKFWSRAMEPWDGPAFITFSDGEKIGARLDRNGFRPCRWTMTEDRFYLCSEAGAFPVDEASVESKGTLRAGSGVSVELSSGLVHFEDPSRSLDNHDARFDPHLLKIEFGGRSSETPDLSRQHLFCYTDEDRERLLFPMILEGKEPIGSMGDTARPAVLSQEPRSFFDYFYQEFAQVTNPPLDYLRESMVTDLTTYLGRRPNIFAPKELIPPARAIELHSPVLSLGQMEYLQRLAESGGTQGHLKTREFHITFRRDHGAVGFRAQLRKIATDAVIAVQNGCSIIILTDRLATYEHPPIPSLLVLRAVSKALNQAGELLSASIVVDTGEVRSTHHVAALVGFGAAAVCPRLALQIAWYDQDSSLQKLSSEQKEKNLLKTFDAGLLKVMAKIGISVVRSYHGARLFTAVGLGKEIVKEYFSGVASPIGGIGIDQLVEKILAETAQAKELAESGKFRSTYVFKEHVKGVVGEKHSMTSARSRFLHKLAREQGAWEVYEEYLKSNDSDAPVTIRQLLSLKKVDTTTSLEAVQPRADILKLFGSGAMSFGAISAESQRDIIAAMKTIGGRSNSGEGGENPYYYIDGTTASTKQVASGRFGVTGEYLSSAEEFQIKVAQGAKPGEGGQLMGVKVSLEIARARHSNMNVDLISPPPLHDIYSIEDLKELIYELKQCKRSAKVSVKLVSGSNIGTIAVGVAKAGADIIHVAGSDGGTGAATLTSMKHAGLPWEIGLTEVHKALVRNGLRRHVTLRVDGALQTGRDIVTAAILGAEEFDFGKLLLVAQGCIMARICEKNTCPTGIATHDPKFKAKYKGTAEDIVRVLSYIADDVRLNLSALGVTNLRELPGRTELLEVDPAHVGRVEARGIDLSVLLEASVALESKLPALFDYGIGQLNQELLDDCMPAIAQGEVVVRSYQISTNDKAALASVSGVVSQRVHAQRIALIERAEGKRDTFSDVIKIGGQMNLSFTGSAGQGFGVFLCDGFNVRLFGEANDSVCKSMSGGRVVIQPVPGARFAPEKNAIIGNCALYGATGGRLYVHGRAGDRFAVRNSGALTVVEGAGLHACEYMTNGTVVILGPTSFNVGAGMTGGEVFMMRENERFTNAEYVTPVPLSSTAVEQLREVLEDYREATGSSSATAILTNWEAAQHDFVWLLPKKVAAQMREESAKASGAAA